MKKYIMFAGDAYYPRPGMVDYQGDFDSIEEALLYSSQELSSLDWVQVVDHSTMEVVYKAGWGFGEEEE